MIERVNKDDIMVCGFLNAVIDGFGGFEVTGAGRGMNDKNLHNGIMIVD